MPEINKTHITSLSITKPYKSLQKQTWSNIPQLVVLTGENGSGKSTLFYLFNYLYQREISHLTRVECNTVCEVYNVSNTPFLLISDLTNTLDNSYNIRSNELKNLINSYYSHKTQLNRKEVYSNSQHNSVYIREQNQAIVKIEEMFQDSFKNIEHEIEKIHRFYTGNSQVNADKISNIVSSKYKPIFLPRFGVHYLQNIVNEGYKNLSTYLISTSIIEKTIKNEDILIKYDDYRKLDIGAEVLGKINITLQKYGFKYKIEYKIDDTNASTQVKIVLTNTKTNKEINTDALSSGEKAILNLLTAAVSKNSQVGKSIILLDEPDANLNPKMTKTLFKVIKEVLVDEYGLQVMLTTHNPVTVYKAKQEGVDIFKMEDGKLLIDSEGKSTISSDEIVSNLLDGIITLDDLSTMFKEANNKKNILLVEGKTDVLHLQSAIEQLNGKHGISINLDKLAIISIGGEDKLDKFIKGYPSKMFKDKNLVALFDNDDAGRKCIRKLGNCYKGDKGNEDKICHVFTLKTPDGYKSIENSNGKILNIEENKSTIIIEKLYKYELIKSFLSSHNEEIAKLSPKSLNEISENQIGDGENIPDHIMFWCNNNFDNYKNSFAEYVKENVSNIDFKNFIPTLQKIQKCFS